VTSQEPRTPQPADRDIPDTEVIVVSAPTPVFVDSTGRRRRRLQRLAYAFGAVCLLYGGLISVSLAGGPVRPSAVLPLPDLPDRRDSSIDARPSPTPEPVVSSPAKTPLVGEALPHRSLSLTRDRHGAVAPKPPALSPSPSAKPVKTPAPSGTTTRPAASPTTPAPAPTPSVDRTPTTVARAPSPPPPSPPSVDAAVGADPAPTTEGA